MMTHLTIQTIWPSEDRAVRAPALWTAFMTGLLLAAMLLILGQAWGSLAPAPLVPVLAALAGAGCCGLCLRLAERWSLLRAAPPLLWLILLLWTGLDGPVRGLKLWLNCVIARWDALHDGGIVLFQVEATARDAAALSLLAAFACGAAAWRMAAGHRLPEAGLLAAALLAVQLIGDTLSPLPCALYLSALLWMWMSDRGPDRPRPVWWVWSAALVLCAALVPAAQLHTVDLFREETLQRIHDLRYGEDVLPLGHVAQAGKLCSSTDEMLTVQTGQEKALYLRGFTGADYRDGVWTPLSSSAYNGDYAGMLDWLAQQGFDPLTQSAQYIRLSGHEDGPETNEVSVHVSGASRYCLYTPASLDAVPGVGAEEKDAGLIRRGLLGARQYRYQETSGSRPAELTVKEGWVSDPADPEQAAYQAA